VADGHLTDIPLESVYSGVVTFRGFRLVLFLGELNGLKTWSTDVGNAYLEAYMSEKVYTSLLAKNSVSAKGIFFSLKRPIRLDPLAKVLREMSFLPCRAEPDLDEAHQG
jgi:hypothetical protein